MDQIVQIAAAAFLFAMAAYVVVLLVREGRLAAVTQRTEEAERAFLKARVADLMAHRKFEQDRAELSWNGFRKFEITRKVPETETVTSFYLQPHDKRPLPGFHPGQFLTFKLDIPGQPKEVIRCYSLSDAPRPDYYRVTIKRLPPPRDKPDAPPGLSSSYFHDQLQEGDILDVKAPSGHFYLDMTKQTPVVLIGGGVGITPVLSMLNAIVESGSKRETWFFLGVRDGRDHVMRDHLATVARENENVHLHVCYSSPGETDVLGRDYHHRGHVGVDLFKELLPSNNYDFYFCGPPPMMDSLFDGLAEWGVPEAHIHFEAFGPATVKKCQKPAAAAAETAAPGVQVAFAKSGKAAPWDPAAGSILEFAETLGVAIDFGCRAGNCGTCLTAIKKGEVEYATPPGEMPEAGSCLACISVPKTDIELDA